MEARRKAVFAVAGAFGCFLIAFLAVMAFSGRFDRREGTNTAGDITRLAASVESPPSREEPVREVSEWVVYVTGAVMRPGIVRVPAGSRIYQAVDAAGGPASKADLESINLASPLQDGQHVRVPFKGEAPKAQPPVVEAAPSVQVVQGGSSKGGASVNVGSVKGEASYGNRVNVNRAGLEELKALPGVGDKTAQAILDYRAANGPFRDVKDLLKVKGIGPKKLEKMAPLVDVSP
ncbi:MAG: helix-hairpin-helix domain-containing protein [Thermanaerothrix sp.]|nr:helix-hairpin-helix domain-containing protein [Thermanaerothrix sp.]